MLGGPTYRRDVEPRLRAALADSPVVLIHGPRQCGKTTLAQMVGDELGYRFVSFDDPELRSVAIEDPMGFVAELPERVILDEVQHVPALFSTLKLLVDRDRVPGRFLLTGSTDVLLLPKLADSLAGRMEIVRLHPLSQAELSGSASGFLDALFGDGLESAGGGRLGGELLERVVSGGYPAALERGTQARRRAWYEAYINTIVQRDVREVRSVMRLDDLARLLTLAAERTAQTLNINALAAPFQLSRPTINQYLTVLERVFLLERLPPWHSSKLRRLIRSPKLHLGDSGLACALLDHDRDSLAADRSALGPLVETFVFQELRRLASATQGPATFLHYRERDGAAEVDIVIERGARQLAGVEVKAGATITPADFKGLKKLRDATGERFAAGVVLYDGEHNLPFGPKLRGVPIRSLWETPAMG
ncbi:MAG: AAA family ATPase [Planctomycetota bacterium]|nr:MAG: AAA family ATPase [Planctomycetota bacterium]